MTTNNMPVKQLVLVPAILTLAVSLVRLVGELMGGPASLFNAQAGGGGALVGIVWLVPVFGIYFALKLVRSGDAPRGFGRAFGLVLLALAVVVAGFVGGSVFGQVGQFAAGSVASVASIFVALKSWPALARTLLAYGLAARIPVAIIMLFAILGNWGTHYDVPPPGLPEGMNLFLKWVFIGLIPQLTLWIAFTLIIGGLFGVTTAVLARRREPATP